MRRLSRKEYAISIVSTVAWITWQSWPENGSDVQQAGPLTWLFLGAVALAIIAGMLIPKPKIQGRFDERPPQLAKRGDQIPYLLGRRILSFKPVWVGRRFSREESSGGGKKGSFFGGGSSKQTVWYESSVHLLGLGPGNVIHRILEGAEKVIFQGPITPADTPSGTSLQDVDGNVFKVYWGERSQPINTDLASDDAFGIASRWPYSWYIQWIDRRLGQSAVWPQIDYDAEALCVGKLPLGDSECVVPATTPPSGTGSEYDPGSQDSGMNGAHMMYQLLTGPYPHGGGIPVDSINWRSLKDLGVLLESEALPQNTIAIDDLPLQDMISNILADAGVFIVEEQGMLVFMPLRDEDPVVELLDNVVVEPLPAFSINHGGLGPDRLVFLFPDVTENFREGDVVTDDDSTAIAMDRKKSQEIRLATITHRTHASIVADRRKQMIIADANEIKLDVNRTMRRLMPGHVANLSDVGQIRVTGVERDAKGNRASITASINQYSLINSDWNPAIPAPAPLPTKAGPDTLVRVLEAPRRFAGETLAIAVVRGRETGDGSPARIFVSLTGTSYTELGFENNVAAYGLLGEDWFVAPNGFEPYALVVPEGPRLTFSTGNASRLLDLSGMDEEWRMDRQVMLIQDEIVSVRRFTALGGGVYTPEDLVREQLFTQHQQHDAAGDLPVLVFEPSNLNLFTQSTWSVGTTLYVKVVPEGQSIDSVDPIEIVLTGKALGALPVDNISPQTYEIGATISFTWTYRLNSGTGAASGELPAGVAIPADPGDEGDYIIEIFDAAMNLKRTETIDALTWDYDSGMRGADGVEGADFFIQITARANGIGGYPRLILIRNV